MTHIPGQTDHHLHHANGEHRLAARTSMGADVTRYEADMPRHQAMHRADHNPDHGPWECYGCGQRLAALTHGWDTRCPNCGSYEIHLAQEAP